MPNAIVSATSKEYYVYIHRRATTGEIFYCGKGYGNRAYDKNSRSQYWKRIANKHGHIVEIVQDGLQEWAALELECAYIALVGRKDCGLGPLINVTDGGEGQSGAFVSNEVREKRRASATNMWTKESHRHKVALAQGVVMKTPEYRKKISLASQANWSRVEYREKLKSAMSVVTKSVEYREKVSNSLKASLSTPEMKQQRREHMQNAMQNKERREKSLAALALANDSKKKKVICVETGVVFSSVQDAMRFSQENGFPKAHSSAISNCCKGKHKIIYGHRWQWA